MSGKHLGYTPEVSDAIEKEYDVKYNAVVGKFLDGMGNEYTLQEAVKTNADNFKRRRKLNKKAYNVNNSNPQLIEEQRKHHFKYFGKSKVKPVDKPFETALDNVIKQVPPASLPNPPKEEFRTPESERMRVPEFLEQEAIRTLLPQDRLKDYEQHKNYIDTLRKQKEEEDKNSSKGLPYILGL
jgi:hypothetical protein